MKKTIRTIGILLILISIWFCSPLAVANSYEMSAEYLYHFSDIRFEYSLLFSTLFFLFTFVKIRGKNLVLLLVFVLWLLSGRYFYLKEFSTCSIGASYYFYQDTRFDLCGNADEDYEASLPKITYEQLPFWRIQFIYGYSRQEIFIGPFAWNSTLQVLLKSTMKPK